MFRHLRESECLMELSDRVYVAPFARCEPPKFAVLAESAIALLWPVLVEIQSIERICARSVAIYAVFYGFVVSASLCWFDQVHVCGLAR